MKEKLFLNFIIALTLFFTGCASDNIDVDTKDFYVVSAQASYEYDVSNMSVVAEVFSNIFIGEIKKLVETRPYENQDWGSPVPYTVYEVKVLKNIKGDADNTSTIIYYGGIDYESEVIYLHGALELPKVGEVYLFTVDEVNDDFDEREYETDFRVGFHGAEMFLIPEYNSNKDLVNQSDIIKDILIEYQIAVEEYEKNKDK